jgi:hypothetical protein
MRAIAANSSSTALPVGVLIEARHSGGSHWYSGKISQVGPDGHGEIVYSIVYDDGDKEAQVKRYRVRRKSVGGKPEEPSHQLEEGEPVDVKYKGG